MIAPSSPVAPEPLPLGLVGLGLVGLELAKRLIAGGKTVVGYDIDPLRRDEFAALRGACVASDAGEVVSATSRVLVSLPSHREVAAVFLAELPNLRPGLVVIDTTTGDPASSETLAASLGSRGVSYLDATLSGSSRQIREGQAVMMVGGNEADYIASRDIFDLIAETSFYTGPTGTGAKMKLITNLVLGLNRAVLAEGLAFAEALSLSPALALQIMRQSPAYSRAMDIKGDKMIRRDFSPDARLMQHLKDVRLILDAGIAAGLPMTLSKAHCDVLEQAVADGLGELDNSAVLQVLSSRASVDQP